MASRLRVWLRVIGFIICLSIIIYFHRQTSMTNLLWMFGGLLGLLVILFDYNYTFNHPEQHGKETKR